jgi:hypothetical protein
VERGAAAADGRAQLDTCDDLAARTASIGELCKATTAREQLAPLRAQRRKPATVAAQHESQAVSSESLGHVAAVDQQEVEQPEQAKAPKGECAGVEPPHDPAWDSQVDDDTDPQAHADAARTERARGQEHERWVISRLGPVRWFRFHVQDGSPARRDAEPPRAQPQPGGGTAGAPHAGPPAQRARESRPRDVDEQRPAAGVPHRDHGGGRAPER